MVQDLQRPDLTLDEEAERNWAEVLSRYYQFNRVKLEVTITGSVLCLCDYSEPIITICCWSDIVTVCHMDTNDQTSKT